MSEFFASDGGQAVAILAVIFTPLTVVGLGCFWYLARREESLVNLKRDLVERGMSADEICRVVEAGTRPPATASGYLKRALLDAGVSAAEIDRVLGAAPHRKPWMHGC